MPARRSPRAVLSTTVLALTLAVAACDGDSPVAPEATAPLDPPGAQPADVIQQLTAGTGILFASARTGGVDIYRMAPDGSNVVRVTSFAGRDLTPAWSWDNQWIALGRKRLDASNVAHEDIFLMKADGSGKHWARSTPSSFDISYPSWSKDGTRLAVSVWGVDAARLAIMTVATGQMTLVNSLLGGPIAYGPNLDPTGKRIVYVGASGGLEMINVDGTGHQVVGPDTVYNVDSPRFSPDGKRIAFGRITPGENLDVYVKNLVDGSLKRLTTNGAADWNPTWSSDGSKIAFVSDRSGKVQIYVMPSTGGTQVRITHTSTDEREPAWSH